MFSELQRLLEQTIAYVDKSDVELFSSRSSNELKREISQYLDELKAGRIRDIRIFEMLFAPTSPLQELSIDNNWGNEFCEIAGQFDSLAEEYKSIYSQPKQAIE